MMDNKYNRGRVCGRLDDETYDLLTIFSPTITFARLSEVRSGDGDYIVVFICVLCSMAG